MNKLLKENYIMVRGAGDLATGIIYRLKKSGFNVIALESSKPSAIRRTVSFCEAIYEGKYKVEDIVAVRVELHQNRLIDTVDKIIENGEIPVIIDEKAESVDIFKPKVLIDAILAKKNLGTTKDMANIVIGLGPGFEAPIDVDVVIETMRGHNLGRLIYDGKALKDTKTPGVIAGVSKDRVIKSPIKGIIRHKVKIADYVKKGEILLYVDNVEVLATIDGVVRGLIREGYYVTEGFKIADIDPRDVRDNCFSISDKARALGGSVLEAILANIDLIK